MPLASQSTVIAKLLDCLEANGIMIFTTGAVDEKGSCSCRHLENDDWPNNHLYIIAQKRPA